MDEEFQIVNKMKCSAKKVAKLKSLADTGNIQAAFAFGDLLMTGAWDMARMESDLALERLIPPPLDPSKDPYLILRRDQYQAINYLRFAADYPHEDTCLEISKARAHLKYCSRKRNFGYNGRGRLDYMMLVSFYTPMEKAATPEDLRFNPFFPLPYSRPKICNPKGKVFSRLATQLVGYNVLQLFTFHILALALIFVGFGDAKDTLVTRQIMQMQMFTLLAFTIPLFLVILISVIFGSVKEKPLCSCSDVRRAYDAAMDGVSDDLKVTDPFTETPFVVRNIFSVQETIFFVYILTAAIVTLLDYTKFIKLRQFIPQNLIYPVIIATMAFSACSLVLLKKLVPPFSDKLCEAQFLQAEMDNKDGFLSKLILNRWE